MLALSGYPRVPAFDLGVSPVRFVLDTLGKTALNLLLIMLLVSRVRQLTGLSHLIRLRRGLRATHRCPLHRGPQFSKLRKEPESQALGEVGHTRRAAGAALVLEHAYEEALRREVAAMLDVTPRKSSPVFLSREPVIPRGHKKVSAFRR